MARTKNLLGDTDYNRQPDARSRRNPAGKQTRPSHATIRWAQEVIRHATRRTELRHGATGQQHKRLRDAGNVLHD